MCYTSVTSFCRCDFCDHSLYVFCLIYHAYTAPSSLQTVLHWTDPCVNCLLMVPAGVASVVTSCGGLCLREWSARTVASRPTSSAAVRFPMTALQISSTCRVSFHHNFLHIWARMIDKSPTFADIASLSSMCDLYLLFHSIPKFLVQVCLAHEFPTFCSHEQYLL